MQESRGLGYYQETISQAVPKLKKKKMQKAMKRQGGSAKPVGRKKSTLGFILS